MILSMHYQVMIVNDNQIPWKLLYYYIDDEFKTLQIILILNVNISICENISIKITTVLSQKMKYFLNKSLRMKIIKMEHNSRCENLLIFGVIR